MAERTTLALQQGVWIDKERLAGAGLQDPLEVTVQPGEIRIRAAKPSGPTESEAVWDVFCSLGCDAQAGRLSDPSAEHDRYLYGTGQ